MAALVAEVAANWLYMGSGSRNTDSEMTWGQFDKGNPVLRGFTDKRIIRLVVAAITPLTLAQLATQRSPSLIQPHIGQDPNLSRKPPWNCVPCGQVDIYIYI